MGSGQLPSARLADAQQEPAPQEPHTARAPSQPSLRHHSASRRDTTASPTKEQSFSTRTKEDFLSESKPKPVSAKDSTGVPRDARSFTAFKPGISQTLADKLNAAKLAAKLDKVDTPTGKSLLICKRMLCFMFATECTVQQSISQTLAEKLNAMLIAKLDKVDTPTGKSLVILQVDAL